MTHRGPFQPLLFCDSVILLSQSRDCSGLVSAGPREIAVCVEKARAAGQPYESPVAHSNHWPLEPQPLS